MKKLLVVAAVAVLSGCSTFPAQRYSLLPNNAESIKALNQNVRIGEFTQTDDQISINCRGAGEIGIPDSRPVSDYIKSAFVSEFKNAGAFSQASNISLSGNVDSLNLDSMGGWWTIQITMKSSNGKSLTVTERYSFPFVYFGDSACVASANYFMPAVQNLVLNTLSHPDFPALIK